MNNPFTAPAPVTSSTSSRGGRRSEEVRRRCGGGKPTYHLLPPFKGRGWEWWWITQHGSVIQHGINHSWENENSPSKCYQHLPGPTPTNRLNRSEGYLMVSNLVIPEHTARRAAEHINITSDGCHISRYATDRDGYSRVKYTDPQTKTIKATGAHRAAWVATHGQIEDGMVIDHLCKNRRCVNVAHLRILSHFENSRRTFNRDWPLGQCVNGHPDTEIVVRSGSRMCRICDNAKHRRFRAKQLA